jgi:1-acyl-sn-glycerol-3-phosphate acyltransferase
LDVFIGLLVKYSFKMDAKFYGKIELFTGLKGWILKKIGGRPVDRSKPNNLVRQVAADFMAHEEYNIVITPEGTRRKVDKFKSGFYFIAYEANVPILPIAMDFGNKVIHFMEPFYPTGDAEKEIAEIEDMFRGIKGKVAENSFG